MDLLDEPLLQPYLARYTPAQRQVLSRWAEAIARTRRAGRVAASVLAKQLAYFGAYDPGLVCRACLIHLERHQGKREAYTRGILRGLAREAEQRQGGDGRGRAGADRQPAARRGAYGRGRYGSRAVDDLPV